MGTKLKPGKFDCYENAAPDEPMFVLLARDPLAPLLVRLWADLRERERGNSSKVFEARTCAIDMEKFGLRIAPPSPPVADSLTREPIESAPKDGTEIVALVSGRAYLVSWGTHAGQHSEAWWRDREGYGLTEPTHWMPLPSAPSASAVAPRKGVV